MSLTTVDGDTILLKYTTAVPALLTCHIPSTVATEHNPQIVETIN